MQFYVPIQPDEYGTAWQAVPLFSAPKIANSLVLWVALVSVYVQTDVNRVVVITIFNSGEESEPKLVASQRGTVAGRRDRRSI
jgi:hypothetical protein